MPMEQRAAQLISSEAILAVSDVAATIRHYRDVLGFTDEWTSDEPPGLGGVRWGRVGITFCLQPDVAAHIEGHQHSFLVDGIHTLYERHRHNGAGVVAPLEVKPWGLWEYTIRDINGYHLRFGEPRSDRPRHDREDRSPPVVIEERKPSVEEYLGLIEAVGWSDHIDLRVAPLALANADFGVVAVEEGHVVGTGLVVDDGAMIFYLKDIIVLPGCQGRGIGTEIVQALIRYTRRTAPSQALVVLFTSRRLAGYYERLGFLGPNDSLQGMWLRVGAGPGD